jgi:hypothetical protein
VRVKIMGLIIIRTGWDFPTFSYFPGPVISTRTRRSPSHPTWRSGAGRQAGGALRKAIARTGAVLIHIEEKLAQKLLVCPYHLIDGGATDEAVTELPPLPATEQGHTNPSPT